MILRRFTAGLALVGAAVLASCTDAPTAPDRSLQVVELGPGTHPDIAGQQVVWQRFTSGPLLHLDLASDRLETLAEADDSLSVARPTVHGDRTAWMERERADDGISIVLLGSEQGSPLRVTDGPVHDRFPRLSGELLVWERQGRSTADIYMRELGTAGEIRIAPSPDPQVQPKVDGHRVVWTQYSRGESGRTDYRVRLFDARAGDVLSLTEDDRPHGNPDVSGDVVVWVAPGGDIEYMELRGNLPVKKGSVDTEASFPAVSVPWIVWVNRDDENIWAHHIDSGATFPVSSNAHPKDHPQISGNRIVWMELQPEGWQIMTATLE